MSHLAPAPADPEDDGDDAELLELDEEDEDDDDDDDDDRRSRSIKRRRGGGGGNAFVDFLLFRKMVGPWVLFVLYWLGVVLVLVFGVISIVLALISIRQFGAVAGLIQAGVALLGMIIAPIVYRVVFELAITVFRIYETLVEIRDKL